MNSKRIESIRSEIQAIKDYHSEAIEDYEYTKMLFNYECKAEEAKTEEEKWGLYLSFHTELVDLIKEWSLSKLAEQYPECLEFQEHVVFPVVKVNDSVDNDTLPFC